jgi:hypothetical protein
MLFFGRGRDLPALSLANAGGLKGRWSSAAAHQSRQGSNRIKSTVRERVKHVFGAQTNDIGGTLVRTIGFVRARAKIGMKNLVYNLRHLCQLSRLNPCPTRPRGAEIKRCVTKRRAYRRSAEDPVSRKGADRHRCVFSLAGLSQSGMDTFI